MSFPDIEDYSVMHGEDEMADITKCASSDCELMKECYRATAQDNSHWQAWGLLKVLDTKGKCINFYPRPKGESK